MTIETTPIKAKGVIEGDLHDFDEAGEVLTSDRIAQRPAHTIFAALGTFEVTYEGKTITLRQGDRFDFPSMASYTVTATNLGPFTPTMRKTWVKTASNIVPPEPGVLSDWTPPPPPDAPERGARLIVLRRVPTPG